MANQRHLFRITVGVDRSAGGEAAVLWAAQQAHLRSATLHLASVYHWSMAEWSAVDGAGLTEVLRTSSLATLERAREQVRQSWPDVVVTAEAIEGHPPAVLTRLSQHCRLVVVGCKHEIGADNVAIGSVATAIASHSSRPGVIVPPRWAPPLDGGVVVGLDPVRDHRAVVGFAFDFAHLAGLPIRFVVCKHSVRRSPDDDARPFPAELGKAIDQVAARFPDVVVRTEVRLGNPAAVLVAQAAGSDLLVLGRHDRQGPLRRLFGSTATATLERATLPVAVVPDAATAETAPVTDDAMERRSWAADYGLSYGTSGT